MNLDRFVYIYAVAAKSRDDDTDDTAFMAKLRESLFSFKKKKAASEAAALEALWIDSDREPAPKVPAPMVPAPKVEKGEKKEKDKRNKLKVRPPKYPSY